jgi:hypothetical protein
MKKRCPYKQELHKTLDQLDHVRAQLQVGDSKEPDSKISSNSAPSVQTCTLSMQDTASDVTIDVVLAGTVAGTTATS